MRILKQNFEQLASVVGGVFINALKPLVKALNTAMGYIISFAETVSNALGKIFGWKFEKSGAGIASDFGDAAESAGDIADSTGTAAKNVEKMKAGLRAFDELKTITISNDDGSSGGSGSGGSSGGTGGSTGGQWTETESILEAFESKIDSLYELGEYIGSTLTDVMNNIDWDEVYQGAKNFGKGLADFLNGLISPELFGTTGRTIAGALNTAIYAALSFGETFDFKDFGLSIATGINEFFRNFDFAALAETLNVWVDGLEETIGTVLQSLDYKAMLKGLYDFFSNLEFDTVSVIIGTLIIKKIGKVAIKQALLGWLSKKIGSLFPSLAGISLPELIISIGSLIPKFQGTASFDVLADWIISGIEDAMDKIFPDWLNDFIGEFVAGFSVGGIATGGSPLGAVIGGLIGSMPDILREKLFNFDWATEWFEEAKRAFTNATNAQSLMDAGTWIVEGILDGIVGAFIFISEPFADLFQWIWDGICEVFGIASPAKEMKPIGEYILLGIVEGFSDKVSEFNTAISTWFEESVKPWFTMEKWQELGDNAKKALYNKWNEFTTWWKETGIYNWWNDNVKPYFTKEKWINISKGVKEGLIEKWNEFTAWWKTTGIYSWWNEHVAPYFSKDKWSFDGIKEGLSSAWNAAVGAVKGIWNNFAMWLNDKLTINIDTSSIIGKGISEILGTSTIKLGNIPTFAVGGFPEDGLFMANHGELVGRFSNGRTAVANNEQITQGIADAVYPAVYNAVSAAMKDSGGSANVTFQVEGDPNGLFKVVRKQANDYTGRTGKPAFDF